MHSCHSALPRCNDLVLLSLPAAAATRQGESCCAVHLSSSIYNHGCNQLNPCAKLMIGINPIGERWLITHTCTAALPLTISKALFRHRASAACSAGLRAPAMAATCGAGSLSTFQEDAVAEAATLHSSLVYYTSMAWLSHEAQHRYAKAASADAAPV